jgi:DNA-binding NarL/FixJ family response regulator
MHAEKELVSTTALLKTLVTSIEEKFLHLNLPQVNVRLPFPTPLSPEIKRELTTREREVAQLLLYRLKNKEIAQKLHLSIRTVRTHRQNIYQKLGVGSLDELLSMFNR